jgi:inner membrane protein
MPRRFWAVALLLSVSPDFDVVGFAAGVEYGDFLGHRGFTHSFLFAALCGGLAAALLVRWPGWPGWPGARAVALATFFTMVTASHGVLDGLTNGGLGIAFFSPFDLTRYFLPWTPIQVSPIGFGAFFTRWGAAVLRSEVVWIGLPTLGVLGLTEAVRHLGRVRRS